MKDPAVLFYTGDFLNGCTDLTLEERGQYITLLCLQHQKGHLSEKTIRLSIGSVSVDVLKKFDQDNEGCYFNKRMDEEIEKRQHFLDTRYFNGKKGGRPIKANNKPNKKANNKPKQNLSENENENENININGFKEEGLLRKKEKNLEARETVFISEVWQYGEQYPKDMLKKFINYWTEKNKSKTKMRFETEKTFEINKRLTYWASRSKEYGTTKTIGADTGDLIQLTHGKISARQQ